MLAKINNIEDIHKPQFDLSNFRVDNFNFFLNSNAEKNLTGLLNEITSSGNPLDAAYISLKAQDSDIIERINLLVEIELLKKKDLISNAYRTYQDMLHYTVFLKEYNSDSISDITEMLYKFDSFPICERYPILIEPLDNDLFKPEDVNKYKQII